MSAGDATQQQLKFTRQAAARHADIVKHNNYAHLGLFSLFYFKIAGYSQ